MDGILTDGRTGKLWMCKKHDGHALGLHVCVSVNNHFVDQLLLFKDAVRVGETTDIKTVSMPDVKIKGTIEGTTYDLECEICGAKRTWWMGEAALERFIENRKRRHEKTK